MNNEEGQWNSIDAIKSNQKERKKKTVNEFSTRFVNLRSQIPMEMPTKSSCYSPLLECFQRMVWFYSEIKYI
jgi:hypothetical protein